MEQIVVAGVGAVGVQRLGALPPVLVQVQVHKTLILENMKLQLVFCLDIVILLHCRPPP